MNLEIQIQSIIVSFVYGMFSSLFGVAVIALPSGIITASYLDELRSIKEGKNAVANEGKD